MENNIIYYPHGEISSLGTLHAMFSPMLQAKADLCIISDYQGCWKTSRFKGGVWPPSPRQKNIN